MGEQTGSGGHDADEDGCGRSGPLVIDCDRCQMQHTSACDDCIVTFLCGGPAPVLEVDELAALRRMHDVGLVPRLRLTS
jgi:hypothetical protein